jgi:hypothetical protein
VEGWSVPDRATRITERLGNELVPDRKAIPGRAQRTPTDDRAVEPDLEPDETLLVALGGIGAVMFLTDRRLIVARDGVERRPRSGIVSYPFDAIRHLRLELGSPPSGRIAVWTQAGQEAVSMFFDARSLDRAHELMDAARPRIARQRRRGPGARPVRPPSGPADSGSDDSTGPATGPPKDRRDDNR